MKLVIAVGLTVTIAVIFLIGVVSLLAVSGASVYVQYVVYTLVGFVTGWYSVDLGREILRRLEG